MDKDALARRGYLIKEGLRTDFGKELMIIIEEEKRAVYDRFISGGEDELNSLRTRARTLENFKTRLLNFVKEAEAEEE